jgi:hypothetical protein
MKHESRVLNRIDRGANDNGHIGRVKPKAELLDVIYKTLGRDHVTIHAGDYHLLERGRWVRRSFKDVMQAVNRKRKALGFVQITEMPGWAV